MYTAVQMRCYVSEHEHHCTSCAVINPHMALASFVHILFSYVKDDGFGCGWWMITFPPVTGPARVTPAAQREEEWGADGRWHIDGKHRIRSHRTLLRYMTCRIGLI